MTRIKGFSVLDAEDYRINSTAGSTLATRVWSGFGEVNWGKHLQLQSCVSLLRLSLKQV